MATKKKAAPKKTGKKHYRKDTDDDAPKKGKKYYGRGSDDDDDDEDDEDEDDRPRRPHGKHGGKRNRKGDFVYITGLFKSESGKASTAFLMDQDGDRNEVCDKLKDAAKKGRIIGVSKDENNRPYLWYIKDDGGRDEDDD